MSQDIIQTDTQNKTDVTQYNSLEEAVFGSEETDINKSVNGSVDIEGAFTSGENKETNTAPQGQPVIEQGETQSNDEKRFQYWQSQADKYKNELESLQSHQKQVQTEAQQQVAAQQRQVQPEEPKREEFPPPPQKPHMPRTFSRDEAYNDPKSESARYQDDLEGWRDDMNEYNTLKTQYQSAVIDEKINSMQEERVREAQRQHAAQRKANQANQIKQHVMGHYGMNDNEAYDFMSKMSDPKSLNIDNLVQLYRLQRGGAVPKEQTTNSLPSSEFQQVQNAQQIPSPMGVMPSGQSNTDTKSFEDKMMDTMIGNFNSKNPWK